jgi:predicted MFS family arabinose efflux permease
VSGIGLGTLAMPPLAAWLIATLGWREAYVVLGALAALVGAGMALMIENDPRDRGLGPDGDPIQPDTRSAQPTGASVRDAVHSRPFLCLFACLISSLGPSCHSFTSCPTRSITALRSHPPCYCSA